MVLEHTFYVAYSTAHHFDLIILCFLYSHWTGVLLLYHLSVLVEFLFENSLPLYRQFRVFVNTVITGVVVQGHCIGKY